MKKHTCPGSQREAPVSIIMLKLIKAVLRKEILLIIEDKNKIDYKKRPDK